jgi:predicted permease
LRFGEAWRLSKTPYVELVYRSTIMTRGTSGSGVGGMGRARSVKSIVRGATVSKILITFFIAFGTLIAFAQYFIQPSAGALVTAVTLSLAIGLGYEIVYSLQILPAFSGAGPNALLTTLPLSQGDLSLVALLSVVRSFDYMVVFAIVSQVGIVAYATGSPLAAAVMALASGANSIFGITISLWLAGIFQRNITRGGRGKGASTLRFVFLVSWGIVAASVGFLFSLISNVFPALESAITGQLSSTAIPLVFSVLHPFNAGIVIATIVYPTLGSVSSMMGLASSISFVALAGYVFLGYFAGRKALSITVNVSRGEVAAVVRQRATDFLLRLRRPIPAYIFKDARVASKNPSTAFVFAMPVFETLLIALSITQAAVLRTSVVLGVLALVCVLTLITGAVLLNTEGTGLDYTFSLPLNAREIIMAKSWLTTLIYLPVPVVIGALLAVVEPSLLFLVAVPVVEIMAISAATSAELAFFIGSYRRREGRQTSRGIQTRGLSLMSGGDVVRLVVALIVSGLIVTAPFAGYGVTYLLTQSRILSIASTALTALAEFIVMQLYLRQT